MFSIVFYSILLNSIVHGVKCTIVMCYKKAKKNFFCSTKAIAWVKDFWWTKIASIFHPSLSLPFKAITFWWLCASFHHNINCRPFFFHCRLDLRWSEKDWASVKDSFILSSGFQNLSPQKLHNKEPSRRYGAWPSILILTLVPSRNQLLNNYTQPKKNSFFHYKIHTNLYSM